MMGIFLVAPASAQQYPPPTPTVTPTVTPTATPVPTATPRFDACASTGVTVKKKNKSSFEARTTFHRGERITIRGGRNCAKKNRRVRASIDVDGEATKIGAADSNDNGGYTITGRIPGDISFGSHPVFVNTGSNVYVTDILVTPAGAAKDANASSTAGPMLAAWVALSGVLAGLLVSQRRRKRQPVLMLAAPSEVPTIDTWDFVPTLPARRRGGAGAKKKKKAPATRKAKGSASKAKPRSAKPKTAKPKPVARKASGATKKPSARKPAAPKRGPKAENTTRAKPPSSKPKTTKRKPPKK